MKSPNDDATVKQAVEDYYRVFSTLDVQAVLRYFHEPCLLISPQGVFAAPTHAALAAAIMPVMEDLRARGYGRSELSAQQVKPLSATAAMVRGVAVRYKIDGQELDQVGVTYLLHKTDAAWKIAVIVLHDRDAAVQDE